ncbi:hypothetical protein CBS101457_002145 [Exobasidium rhododendri]|nr:hypothetical protein CBS101457_002145 [Exobasidium rhododendri]
MATLNVKDALSYLDQVKVQFSDHPDVYNRFLDIMKDFKSQSIDTPGVIERVSTLFRGHPSLIQGFNTFLPPGYRIECSLDPSKSNLITVTTPTGTTTQTPDGVGIAGAISRLSGAGSAAVGPRGSGMMNTTARESASNTSDGELSEFLLLMRSECACLPVDITGHTSAPSLPAGSLAGLHGHRPHSPSAPLAPATPGATAGAGVLSHGGGGGGGGADGPIGDGKRPPVEFNHAINYVNKIKQRFSSEPDTYKQFLEILQTYQKEQKPIHDVYAQVTLLFDNSKDLLDEFKQFLPDTSNGQTGSGYFMGMLGQVTSGMSNPSLPAPSAGPPIPMNARMDVMNNDKKVAGIQQASAPNRKKRNAGGADGSRVGAKTKKAKSQHTKDRSPMREVSPGYGHHTLPVGGPGMMHGYGPDAGLMPSEVAMMQAGMMGPGGMPMGPGGPMIGPSQTSLATVDEVAFFERVKKFIDDRPTYIEFLKLLNLFTQDIIDLRTLVDRAALFIGGNRDLFTTFKNLCGYEMGKQGWLDNEDPIIENVPALQRDRVELSACKLYGASYRKLPKSEVNLACSGRDPMCWEVLNDAWVSHPTLASEGESFNPHKKNVYEDALYRSEEERHEYDYHIEANLRTIALLEPIAARISMMDPEERQAFRLKPGLGGQSKSIYQRVIKKVYGREHGIEVIGALHDNPCNAVPVVLARLKQKDEEWKRCQREWNKVWREVDARNYYKSLDHQGVNFKTADKKAITSKALVAEIESRRIQQLQRRLAIDATLPRPRVNHQLTYKIDDLNVLVDVVKLAFSFLDRAAYNKADCDRIEALLRGFLPKMLGLNEEHFAEMVNGDVLVDDEEDDVEGDDGASEAATDDEGGPENATTSTSAQRRGKNKAGDLRRKVLKTQVETSTKLATTENGTVEGSEAALSNARTSSPGLANEVSNAADALGSSGTPVAAVAVLEDAGLEPSSIGEQQQKEEEPSARVAAAIADVEMADGDQAAPPPSIKDESSYTVSSNENSTESTWIRSDTNQVFDSTTGQTSKSTSREAKTQSIGINFFCSTPHYVFLRLLQILYARLCKMKKLGNDMAEKERLGLANGNGTGRKPGRANPMALELGLQDPHTGPAAVVGAAAAAASLSSSTAQMQAGTTALVDRAGLNGHADEGDSSGILLSPARYYDTLLDLSEKFFDGELDSNTFEESIRYMFGIDGYLVFTLDKVVGALIKAAQVIMTDSKCQELQTLMEEDKGQEFQDHIARRMKAESIVGKDENLYRIEWVPAFMSMASKLTADEETRCDGTLLMQLLSRDDLTLDEDFEKGSTMEKWLYYISTYTLWTPTEGLKTEAKGPFLDKSLKIRREVGDDAGTTYSIRNGLEIKVCISTYRLFYSEETEDYFARLLSKSSQERVGRKMAALGKKRTSKFNQWLEIKEQEAQQASAGPEEQPAEHEGDAAPSAVAEAEDATMA